MNTLKVKKKRNGKRAKIEAGDSLNEQIITARRPKKPKINESDSESNEKKSEEEDVDSTIQSSSRDESSSEETDLKDSENTDSFEKSIESKESEENYTEENRFNALFQDVCKIFENFFSIDKNLIASALRDIKESFKPPLYNFNSLNFRLIEYSFAYFKYYSTFNAEIARDRFLNAIINCETLQTVINKPRLNVISLGGGPGTDMVGFCSAFKDCRVEPVQLLNLCVVDKWKKWESFYDIIKMLLREKDYVSASKVFQNNIIFTSFLEIDLLNENPPQKYNSALKNADIVLLSRVLDTFNFQEVRPENVLCDISNRMKKNALLLLLDSNVGNYDLDGNFEKIYDPDLGIFESKFKRFPRTSKAQIAVLNKL